ncbi:MAG: DUF5615 family PIN-like protein [Calditrichota bacterium]
MRFLCNENIPLEPIHKLRSYTHDVYSIMENNSGISDSDVMELAIKSNYIILTFDRDYGELIFKKKLPVPPGVIYLRFIPTHPTETAELLQQLFDRDEINFDGFFTVIGRENIRQRRLP